MPIKTYHPNRYDPVKIGAFSLDARNAPFAARRKPETYAHLSRRMLKEGAMTVHGANGHKLRLEVAVTHRYVILAAGLIDPYDTALGERYLPREKAKAILARARVTPATRITAGQRAGEDVRRAAEELGAAFARGRKGFRLNPTAAEALTLILATQLDLR
jgi:hypothetical protein